MREGRFQDPYFYYLSGWSYPDAGILLTKNEEFCSFLHETNGMNIIMATGPRQRMPMQQR